MELNGEVQHIIYRNTENGWTVLDFLCDDDAHISVVGILPLLTEGDRAKLIGNFTVHPKYGKQFKTSSSELLTAQSTDSIKKYLASGLIKGIGPATASAIVEKFGEDTLTILDTKPERLLEINGIGNIRMQMIASSYAENRSMRSVLLALTPYGITPGQALKLFKIYGESCIARLQEDPYQLIRDVEGIGFITADKIARSVEGFEEESDARLRAGLAFSLELAKNEYGHTYVPKDKLISYASSLLGVSDVPLGDALDRMIFHEEAIEQNLDEEDCIFLPSLYKMESLIAQRLIKLKEAPEISPFSRILTNPKTGGIELSEQQKEAIDLALSEGVLVITGGPGTGKTTIIRYIAEMLNDLGMDFALTAPTGRASKRMSEATGIEAKTIHRLLEYVPGEGFLHNQDDPLYYDMIIVDEASMIDVPLMHALTKAIPEGTRLILVGDVDQLPPVGAGNVLKDIIESDVIKTVRLTEIYRQAQKSLIVTNAHRINNGTMPVLDMPLSDFRFEHIDAQDMVLERIKKLLLFPSGALFTREPIMDVQILAPMKKGLLGVYELNKTVQSYLNPPEPDKPELLSGETVFRFGDRVMQIKNNYKLEWKKTDINGIEEGTGVFNGDLGTVYKVDTSARYLQVLFDDGRLAVYDSLTLSELNLAYCISIHKSQGSEFPIVIIPLIGAATPLLTRNLLYTAVTRAKKQVVCLGREDTMLRMIRNDHSARRYTALKDRLIQWQETMDL